MALDAASVTLIQTHFLQYLGDGFSSLSSYALDLLYFFALFEVVIFGMLWALQQEAQWARLFFKVIKIGFVFFIIHHFANLVDAIVRSFADIGGTLASMPHLGDVIFNPAILWQYGYDSSLALLQAGSASNISMGLAMVQIFLGIGILVCFALLGIQIVLQVVSFYFVSLMGLIFLPFGVFSPTTNMVEQGFASIFKAGVRLVVLIMIIGTAVATWQLFHLGKHPISLTVNQALGLFDTALLFTYLAIRMPGLVSQIVGRIDFSLLYAGEKTTTVVNAGGGSAMPASPSHIGSMQAATVITPSSLAPAVQMSSAQASLTATSQAASVPSVNVSIPSFAKGGGRAKKPSQMGDANAINKTISDDSLEKLGKVFKEALDSRFRDESR